MTNSIIRILMKFFIVVLILFTMTFMRMNGVPAFLSVLLGFGAIAGVLRYKSPDSKSDNDPKLKK